MPVTLLDAARITPNPTLSGILESVTVVDPLFKVLPFYRNSNGLGVVHKRVTTRPTTAFIGYGGAVAESAASFEDVTTMIRTIAHDTDVAGISERLTGSAQASPQLSIGAGVVARMFQTSFVNGGHATAAFTVPGLTVATNAALQSIGPLGGTGPRTKLSALAGPGSIRVNVAGGVRTIQYRSPGDVAFGTATVDVAAGNPTVLLRSGQPSDWLYITVNSAALVAGVLATTEFPVTCTTAGAWANSFDGVLRLCDPRMLRAPVAAAGDNISGRMLRELAALVPDVPGTQKVFMMNPREALDLRDILDAVPGSTIRDLLVSNYGFSMPQFDGIPIFTNPAIQVNEPIGAMGAVNASRVYCMNLGLPTGAREEAPLQGPGIFGVYGGTDSAEAEGRTCAGMFAGRLMTRESWDLGRYRVGWDAGIIHYATEGLACAWGVIP